MYRIALFLFAASGMLAPGCLTTAKNQFIPPANALERLQAGNRRFAEHHPRHPDQSAARLAETAAAQKPFAVVVACSDSRVPPEIVFDEGIGDLFVVRNAGNIVEEEDVLASVEYAVAHLGVRTVVVMGHEHCGAIGAMTQGIPEDEPEHIAAIVQKLKNEPEEQVALHSGEKGDRLVHKCVVANVEHGTAALRRQLHNLKGHGSDSEVSICGAVYDIQTGIVHFLNVPSSSH